jgi:hypothetical protein
MRIGKFKIENEFIRENEDAVLSVMGKVIVVRAELMWASDKIEYVAKSKEFDEVLGGNQIPEYNILFENGMFSKFIKEE